MDKNNIGAYLELIVVRKKFKDKVIPPSPSYLAMAKYCRELGTMVLLAVCCKALMLLKKVVSSNWIFYGGSYGFNIKMGLTLKLGQKNPCPWRVVSQFPP